MTIPHGYLMLFPHYLREGVTVEPLIVSLPPEVDHQPQRQ
jgi:hypothetical protein